MKQTQIKMKAFTKPQMKQALACVNRTANDKDPFEAVIKNPGMVNLECLAVANAHFTRGLLYFRKLPNGKVRVGSLGKQHVAKKPS